MVNLAILVVYFSVLLEACCEKTFLPIMIVALEMTFLFFKFLSRKKIKKVFLLETMAVIFAWLYSASVNPSNYFIYVCRITLCFLQLVVGKELFGEIFQYKEKRKIFLKAIIVLFTTLALYCVFEGLHKSNPVFVKIFREKWKIKAIYGYARGYRAAGSMESPLVMSFPIIIVIYVLFLIWKQYQNKKCLLLMILCLISIPFFKTRTAYLACILGLVLGGKAYLHEMKPNELRFLVMCSSITFLAIMFFYWDNIQGFFTSDTMSYIHRATSIRLCMKMFLESNPFKILLGNGMGSLSYKIYTQKITITTEGFFAVDNELITFLYEFGLMGIMVIGVYMYKWIQKIKKNINTEYAHISIMIIPLLVIYLMSFDMLHWFSIAVLCSVLRGYFERKENTYYEN